MLDALRAQENLAQAMEAQLTDAAALLARIHGDIEEIERTNDVERKRQIVELLVKEIRVSTVEGERAPRVDVRYLFGRPSTPLAYAESPTLWRS